MSKKKASLQPLPKEVSLMISNLLKDYGKGSIMRLGDDPFGLTFETQYSTGSLALDLALGTAWKNKDGIYQRGIPGGKIVEIFGPESSGKTTLLNHLIASAQHQGGLAAFIDVEQAWDRRYAAKIGVDTDNLIFSQPDSGEQALQTMNKLLITGKFAVIGLDSIAGLIPQCEIDNGLDDNSMGAQGRMMSKALRNMSPKINKTNTLVVFTNQIREKVGVIFGNPETTPGGNAMKFWASLRFDIRKTAALKDANGVVYGHRAKVKVIKNKMSIPFTMAEFDLSRGRGIDKVLDLVDTAIFAGVIQKKGSWYSYGSEQIGQGSESVKEYLSKYEEMAEAIRNEVIVRFVEGEVPDEPVEPVEQDGDAVEVQTEQVPDETAGVATA